MPLMTRLQRVPDLTPEQIASAVATGHRLGWQVVAHVTGDAGVDVVLDAIEAAQRQDPKLGIREPETGGTR